VRNLKISEDEYPATLNKLVVYYKEVPAKLKEYINLTYPINDVADKLAI
jgi:hypothetical protein